MNYEDEKNRVGETETLSSDEQNVARLLSGLKRVDAPKDFDFHLKARIANATPADYKPVKLFPVLRYVLPLALFLVAGGAILNSSYSSSDVPAVADGKQSVSSTDVAKNPVGERQDNVVSPQIKVPEEVLLPEVREPMRPETVAVQTRRQTAPRSRKPAINDVYRGGGSYDTTINNAPPPTSAPVLSSNSNSAPKIPLQVRQMFMSLGIDATDGGEKNWTIRGLTKDGIAERSGLRVGDTMEALDDKPINPLYVDSFSLKSISVRRDGSVVKVELQPNKP